MSRDSKRNTRLRAIDDQLIRFRAERIRLIARANQAARTRDTQRTILVGAAVLAAVDGDGVPAVRTIRDLVTWLDARLTRPILETRG